MHSRHALCVSRYNLGCVVDVLGDHYTGYCPCSVIGWVGQVEVGMSQVTVGIIRPL